MKPRNFGPVRSYRLDDPHSDWDDPQPAKTAFERHRDRIRRRNLYLAVTLIATAGLLLALVQQL